MRSTLFYIPHEIGPLTFFGWGWALIALAVAWFLSRLLTKREGAIDWQSGLGTWAFVAILIAIVAPFLESKVSFADGSSAILGLPVRGYGVMLLTGVLSASTWTYFRGKPFGITIDSLCSLAFWGMIGGIGGARLFYVIQKWSEFQSETLAGKLVEALQFTEGGLVVYGGVIGGLIATGLWCYLRGSSYLMLADIVTPAFLIGLAFGRIGCLLNGCCFGGVCFQELPAIAFPQGSPPYVDQLDRGELLGAVLNKNAGAEKFTVVSVEPSGWATEQQIVPGDQIQIERVYPDANHRSQSPEFRMIVSSAKGARDLPLPARSLPVHPTQVYAAVNAAILSGLLACIPLVYSWRGFVFSIGLILYGISRIVEEFIRVDEAGQFGTSFSIGQWVSFVGILVGCAILIYVQSRRSRLVASGALRTPPAIQI